MLWNGAIEGGEGIESLQQVGGVGFLGERKDARAYKIGLNGRGIPLISARRKKKG